MISITSKDYDVFIELLKFRYSIYCEELSYIKSDEIFNLLKMEFDEFDKNATHFILKENDEIIGCSRINVGSDLSLYNKLKDDRTGIFGHENNNLEITRLMLRKDKRSTGALNLIIKAMIEFGKELNYDYILADVFVKSPTYKTLKKRGFNECYEFMDENYNVETPSVVVYMSKNDFENNQKLKK